MSGHFGLFFPAFPGQWSLHISSLASINSSTTHYTQPRPCNSNNGGCYVETTILYIIELLSRPQPFKLQTKEIQGSRCTHIHILYIYIYQIIIHISYVCELYYYVFRFNWRIPYCLCVLEVVVQTEPDELDEIRGLELKNMLGHAEVLSYFFLSSLCLHHYLHECCGRMEPDAWRKLHDSVADTVPGAVLQKIYFLIRRQWIPQFSIPALSSKSLKRLDPPAIKSNSLLWLHSIPSKQGWLSVTSNPPHEIGYPGSKKELWVSISVGLLFFSLAPSSASWHVN